jgi:hypothetical protein
MRSLHVMITSPNGDCVVIAETNFSKRERGDIVMGSLIMPTLLKN